MKKQIVLVGGGGHCKACIDAIEESNCYEIVAIVDLPDKVGTSILGHEIKYTDSDLKELCCKYKNFLITLGQIKSPSLRVSLFNELKSYGADFPIIISPRGYVSKHAQIGEGSIIMHDALVNADAKLGVNCIINNKCLIEHDVKIGDHCHISTASVVNGGAVIGDRVFIGSNSIIRDNITIASDQVISAGIKVMKSI